MLENINDDPLGGHGAGNPRASTINVKKRQRRAPWLVSELEIWEHPPSTLGNIDGAPLGGTGARDSGEPTINVKIYRRRVLWEVTELEIRGHPPSTLGNIEDRHPDKC
jgi:hypothetical protein